MAAVIPAVNYYPFRGLRAWKLVDNLERIIIINHGGDIEQLKNVLYSEPLQHSF